MAAEGEGDVEGVGPWPQPPEQHGRKPRVVEAGLVASQDVVDLAQDGGGATGVDGGGAGGVADEPRDRRRLGSFTAYVAQQDPQVLRPRRGTS